MPNSRDETGPYNVATLLERKGIEIMEWNPREETSIRVKGNFDDPAAEALHRALIQSLAMDTKIPEWIRTMDGMSGKKFRYLINNLISATVNARYLEIGSWAGSTACSAMFGNMLRIRCIDNWSEFGGPKSQFFSNINRCKTDKVDFSIIEDDFRAVDFSSIGLFNVYLFDGPHTEADQRDGVVMAQGALDQQYTLIVDDWNWEPVRNGTRRALQELETEVIANIEIRTTH